jgi:hypothetical protein
VTGKRLAAAGRQQREDVFARQRIADNFLLQRTERGETEVLLQQREQVWRNRVLHQRKGVRNDRNTVWDCGSTV